MTLDKLEGGVILAYVTSAGEAVLEDERAISYWIVQTSCISTTTDCHIKLRILKCTS